MRVFLTTFGAVLIAGASYAHDGVKDPDVKARMHLMMQVKEQMGTLGKMANGAMPFDADRAQEARAALLAYTTQIPKAFETPAQDPKSEALVTIWTSFPDFLERTSRMHSAFTALDASTQAGLQSGLAAAAGTCKSCHSSYRAKK